MIIILLILLLFVFEYPKIFIPIIAFSVGVAIISVKKINNKILKEERTIAEAKKRFGEKYDEIRSRVTIPAETRIVYYKEGDANILNGNLQAWIEDSTLCFFPFIISLDEAKDIDEKVKLFKILINDINSITRDDEDKKTILKYYFNGKGYSMIFSNKDFNILKEMLPEKACSPIESNK